MSKKQQMMAAAGNNPFNTGLTEMVSEMVDESLAGESITGKAMGGDAVKATSGAAAGCKPGSTRHTYVMPLQMIGKLKAIAGYLGKPEVAVVLEMLNDGIAKCEEKYGVQVSDLNRAK